MTLTPDQAKQLADAANLAKFLMEPIKDPFGRDTNRFAYLYVALAALDRGEMTALYAPLNRIDKAVSGPPSDITVNGVAYRKV